MRTVAPLMTIKCRHTYGTTCKFVARMIIRSFTSVSCSLQSICHSFGFPEAKKKNCLTFHIVVHTAHFIELLSSKIMKKFYIIERMNQSNSQTTNFIVLKSWKVKKIKSATSFGVSTPSSGSIFKNSYKIYTELSLQLFNTIKFFFWLLDWFILSIILNTTNGDNEC
jgi:hypothetical protein